MRLLVVSAVLFAAIGIPVGAVALTNRRRSFVTQGQAATFEVLHTANLAAPVLRAGLTSSSLQRAAPHLLALVGSPVVAVATATEILCLDGTSRHHGVDVLPVAQASISTGRSQVHDLVCGHEGCAIRKAVAVPIEVRRSVIGALVAFDADGSPGLIRAMTEVAAWIRSHVELAELDENRVRLARAELRALRAQISPHFIYNALTAIASFTRSDPDRARELLLEFADFTRYSLSSHGEFTTVAEELRSIERYLTLEKARFGDRLTVDLRVAPEVLTVALPFLVIQPLVENAVRHGIERRPGVGRVAIVAAEQSNECVITVEDNGVGADPEALQSFLNGSPDHGDHVGLYNIDERLRTVYGPSHGLTIDTAPGAGTKVTVRVPKYRPGVRAS
jgi:two-component system, LytTR family, sensor kinase